MTTDPRTDTPAATPVAVIPDEAIERVLVVAAHPDDADFGSAGAVAVWTSRGIEVSYLILTDGQAGGFDESTDRSEIPAIRRAEQTKAAAEVGVTDVHFAGYVDGELEVTHALVRDIVRVIRQVRPQRMVFQSPARRFDVVAASHPDHLAAGEATIRALYPFSRNPFAYPELLADEKLEAWTVGEMWLTAHPTQNHAVDVTDVVEAKMAAIFAHVSQHAEPELVRGWVTGWLTSVAAEFDLGEGRLAEGFAVFPTG
jgi:LmbE family N-acetylglucosaminyl deacetylase